MKYRIYADGGCAPSNPGPGGFGYVIEGPDGVLGEGFGYQAESTNNRMELMAVISALRELPAGCRVELVLDSKYVLDGCTTWRKGWLMRGMRKADGSMVLNADLWPLLWDEVDARHVSFQWVKGHSGNKHNERADSLCAIARSTRTTKLALGDAPQELPMPADPLVALLESASVSGDKQPLSHPELVQLAAKVRALCREEMNA